MQKKSSGSRRWRRRRGGDGGGGSGRGQREAIRTRRVSRADAERDARILESRERTPQNAFLSSALAEAQREETTKSIFHVLRTQLEANVKKSDLWTFALAVVLQHPTLTSEERKIVPTVLAAVMNINAATSKLPDEFVVAALRGAAERNFTLPSKLLLFLFRNGNAKTSKVVHDAVLEQIEAWLRVPGLEGFAIEASGLLRLNINEKDLETRSTPDFRTCSKIIDLLNDKRTKNDKHATNICHMIRNASRSIKVIRYFARRIVVESGLCKRDNKKALKVLRALNLGTEGFPEVVRECQMGALRWLIAAREIGMIRVLMKESLIDTSYVERRWHLRHRTDLRAVLAEYDRASSQPPDASRYYRLPPDLPVVDVRTSDELDKATGVLVESSLVGMDAEWRPVMTVIESAPSVSLLQIATTDVAFLLDVPAFLKTPDLRLGLVDALRRIFTSAKTITISFDGRNDVQMLVSSLVDRKRAKGNDMSWLSFDADLKTDADKLRSSDATASSKSAEKAGSVGHSKANSKRKKKTKKGGGSLSKLVEHYFGKPLNKDVRMSDWNRRPLTVAQRHYAAADAYVLVSIYREIQRIRSLPASSDETGTAQDLSVSMSRMELKTTTAAVDDSPL